MSIPRLDVFAPDFLRDQDDLLNAARERHPFAISDRGVEILGYRECQALLLDRRVQEEHMATVNRIGITDPEVISYKRRILASQGMNANRDRMRSMFARASSARQMNRLRTEIRAASNEILDDVQADEPIDFMRQVAKLIPSTFFCKWVGLPPQDAQFVSDMSDILVKIFWVDPNYTENIQVAYKELFAYLDRWLDRCPDDGGEGFLTHLLREQRRGNVYPKEIRDWVVFALESSTDSISHQIGLALGRLLETPELLEQLRCNHTLLPAVVEESMRLDARVRVIHRLVTEDIEATGYTFHAGTDMFFWVRAAHLDPRAFGAPEKFDINRPKTPGTLMFGRGASSCLGQWMARTEVQETLRATIDRFPSIRLTGTPERSIDMFSFSADRLPVVLNG